MIDKNPFSHYANARVCHFVHDNQEFSFASKCSFVMELYQFRLARHRPKEFSTILPLPMQIGRDNLIKST
jgi:hypothetical protein